MRKKDRAEQNTESGNCRIATWVKNLLLLCVGLESPRRLQSSVAWQYVSICSLRQRIGNRNVDDGDIGQNWDDRDDEKVSFEEFDRIKNDRQRHCATVAFPLLKRWNSPLSLKLWNPQQHKIDLPLNSNNLQIFDNSHRFKVAWAMLWEIWENRRDLEILWEFAFSSECSWQQTCIKGHWVLQRDQQFLWTGQLWITKDA